MRTLVRTHRHHTLQSLELLLFAAKNSVYLYVFTSKAAQISPQNVGLGWQSRVMHRNVQIRAKGHFLPQFVKHNSNNNNEVWFYKERGRLDMLVWFLANIRSLGQGLSTAGAQHRMDFGQMKEFSEG